MPGTYRGNLIQTQTGNNDDDEDDDDEDEDNDEDDDDKLLGLSTWPVWVECESPLSWLLVILLLHSSFQIHHIW